MHTSVRRTTVNIPEKLMRQAKIKALREDVTVSEVIRELLARWVADEVELDRWERGSHVRLARAARGMWADRDVDEYLARSRAGLRERDGEVTDARLDA